MSYSSSGILDALEFSPIGGGPAYSESAGKLHPSEADVEVSTADGLLEALDGSSDVIAIANDAVIDLTGVNMTDLGSKTLVSYRGWDGQDGALIYTDSRGYYGSRPYTLFYSFGSPRVTGLRIRGARYDEEFTRWDYADNLARGIMLRGPGGEIDNCELWGWTWNAIHLRGEGEEMITEAEVHHNHVHQSYQLGYGYGVAIWRGFGEIHDNYFDEVRRSISGYGWWNSGYVVENNVFGPQHQSHSIDMHCLEENDASARVGDDQDDPNYDLRAGGEMVIRNNTFTYETNIDGGPVNTIAIRGVPWEGVWIEDNRFTHPERPPYNSGNTQEGFAWRQVNLNLSGWGDIPQDDEGYTLNWTDEGNQFAAPDTPRESGVGAPVDLGGGETILTVSGGGSRSYYTFSVDGDVEKSEAYGGTINPNDEITAYDGDDLDTIVAGWTTNEPDSYVIDGEITSLSASASPDVSINGETVNPNQFGATVITIEGRGETANYELEFAGDVEKSTTYGGTINSYDEISDSTVAGRTTREPDSFIFTGEITGFSADSPVDVSFNGQPTGLWF
ncbi:hypothetical protein [Halalkalicoccus ordinarius]|uniref:hypothetical protein n=1 Tax=Halalkalicoccus ordinarius TaxID=3116651 RepID=UPI00300E88D6